MNIPLNNHRVRIIPTGHCLVSALAEDLSSQSAKELQQTLILLPTRRLQLHLGAALCRFHNGASWLPMMSTWEQFLEKTLQDYMTQDTVMVSDAAELLFAELLKNQRAQVPNERHAHELLHLLKELWRNGVRDSALEDMKAWLERQWHLSELGQRQLFEKLDQVFATLKQFEDFLILHHLDLPERRLYQGLRQGMQNLSARTLPLPYRRIVVAGLTTLPKVQLEFLKQLTNEPLVEVWLDATWPELDSEAPLRKLHNSVPSKSSDQVLPPLQVRGLHACSNPLQEVSVALERAHKAVKAGIPWHRITIAVPDEKIYASSFAALCSDLNMDCNIPLARPWSSTPLGQWVSLLQVWLTDHTTHALIHVLSHPFTLLALKPHVPYPDMLSEHQPDWEQWLVHCAHKISTPTEFERCLKDSPLKPFAQDNLFAVWTLLRGDFAKSKLPKDLPLVKWWQEDVFETLASHLESEGQDAVNRSSFQALRDAFETLKHVQGTLQQTAASAKHLLTALVHLASQSSPRDVGEPLSGLQIVSVTEARYVPCDVLIIVGLCEGVFPHKLPQDTLVDNTLKVAAGMSSWRQLEALEESTFHLLVTRVPHVELTWPLAIGESEKVRSRWVERLVAAGVLVTTHTDAVTKRLVESIQKTSSKKTPAVSQASISVEPLFQKEGIPSQGSVAQYFQILSARSLKHLMSCPYRFLMEQQGIKSIRLRQEEDSLDIGDRLHKVIEYTCKQHMDETWRVPEALRWRREFQNAADVESWALPRLLYFSERLLPPSLAEKPLVLEVIHKGWPALAKSWGDLWLAGWNPALARVELRLEQLNDGSLIGVQVGGKTIQIKGIMDMLLTGPKGHWCIIDFKTRFTASASDVRTGKEPQLMLYAICMDELSKSEKRQHASSSQGMIAYWNLLDGAFQEIARGNEHGLSVSEAMGAGSKNRKLPDFIEEFKLHLSRRIQKIEEEGRFYADPSTCLYCDFSGICRKDDPRFQDQIRDQITDQTSRGNP